MYLMIENKGEADVDSLIVLGVSSSRGDKAKIGQFGSGFCHGILTCLRENIIPAICVGENLLEFSTEKNNKLDRVIYSYKGVVERLSMSLGFGELDWTSLDMGLREFVSNAIDNGVDGEYSIQVVSAISGRPGYTRVFIPYEGDVVKFHNDIPIRFMQFNDSFKALSNTAAIFNTSGEKSRFYRKGVFVRESNKTGLYSYNFDDSVKIDECRNMNEYSVCQIAARMWRVADVETLKGIFSKLGSLCNKEIFEATFNQYSLEPYYSSEKNNWLNAFVQCFGDKAVIAMPEHAEIIGNVQKKGYTCVIIPSASWYTAMAGCIPTALSKMGDNRSSADKAVSDAPTSLVNRATRIWNKLEKYNLTNDKTFPKIAIFVAIMDGGCETLGYYDTKTKTVCINKEYVSSKQTILEELGHYITEATDCSRDFQDWCLKVASSFL